MRLEVASAFGFDFLDQRAGAFDVADGLQLAGKRELDSVGAVIAFVVVRGLAPQLGALAGALGYGAGYAAALMLGIWLLKRD